MSDHIEFCRRENLPEDPLTLAESLLISRHTLDSLLAALDDATEAYAILERGNSSLREALRHFIDHARGVDQRYGRDDLIRQAEAAIATR